MANKEKFNMNARFPIGLVFQRKRFPKAKELTTYTIRDIYRTYNNANELRSIVYLVTHDFMGQQMSEQLCDTTIARSLTNEQLQQFI